MKEEITLAYLKNLMLNIKTPEGHNLFLSIKSKTGKDSIVKNYGYHKAEDFFQSSNLPEIKILREVFGSCSMAAACVKSGYTEIPKCPICGKPRAIGKKGEILLQTCGDKSCAFKCMVNNNKDNHGGVFSTAAPECIEKRKRTCLEKYGVDAPMKSEELKAKVANTNVQRYGTTVPVNSPKLHAVAVETCIRKYGVKNYTQTDEFKQKYRATCLSKYGVPNSSMSKEVREKAKRTCEERYGVDSFAKTQEFRSKMKDVHQKLKEKGYRPTPQSKYR